jgi:hypothetical protein
VVVLGVWLAEVPFISATPYVPGMGSSTLAWMIRLSGPVVVVCRRYNLLARDRFTDEPDGSHP